MEHGHSQLAGVWGSSVEALCPVLVNNFFLVDPAGSVLNTLQLADGGGGDLRVNRDGGGKNRTWLQGRWADAVRTLNKRLRRSLSCLGLVGVEDNRGGN